MNVTFTEHESAMLRTLRWLFHEGDTVEVRIPGADGRRGRTDSGYFTNLEKLVKEAGKRDGKAPAIYFTLNPVDPALKARADHRIKEWADSTTADKEIIIRRNLLVDCDPVRPAGISSTNTEHQAALDRAQKVRAWLTEQGWSLPLYADSGNGAHLIYPINLPNSQESTDLLKRTLEALARRFDDDTVKIDTGVYNAARISKLYGTLVCKGDNTADRPHRRSGIIEIPES